MAGAAGEHEGRGDQARTRLARRAVALAARDLFLDQGYAATTVESISLRSEVPPATVYRLFRSKLGILRAVLDAAIAGDGGPLPVRDQAGVAALFTEPDPPRRIAGFARLHVALHGRSAPIYRILAGAAGSDPEAAALLAEYTRERDAGQGGIARSLARDGALRAGIDERDAADLIHALMSPELYRLLVSERGWSPRRYERWLAATLADQMLPRTDPERPPPTA